MILKAEQREEAREDLQCIGPKAEGYLRLGECRPGALARIGTKENQRRGWERERGRRRGRRTEGTKGERLRDKGLGTEGRGVLGKPLTAPFPSSSP